jgi:hypothetical protein
VTITTSNASHSTANLPEPTEVAAVHCRKSAACRCSPMAIARFDLQIPFAAPAIFIARVIKACVSVTVRPLSYLDRRPRLSQSHLIE